MRLYKRAPRRWFFPKKSEHPYIGEMRPEPGETERETVPKPHGGPVVGVPTMRRPHRRTLQNQPQREAALPNGEPPRASPQLVSPTPEAGTMSSTAMPAELRDHVASFTMLTDYQWQALEGAYTMNQVATHGAILKATAARNPTAYLLSAAVRISNDGPPPAPQGSRRSKPIQCDRCDDTGWHHHQARATSDGAMIATPCQCPTGQRRHPEPVS